MKSRSPDFYLTPGESRVTFSTSRFRDIPAAPALRPVSPVAVSAQPAKEPPQPTSKPKSNVPPDPDR